LRVRIERMVSEMEAGLSALQQAETMIKDCASFLTSEQRVKLSVHSEVYQIEMAKAKMRRAIETYGGAK
jgi:pyridoxine 5'-phosphate synthase PdxJ